MKQQFSFLHIADIHLGCTFQRQRWRERDFFFSFYDAVKKYALAQTEGSENPVDFVLIAGDLFDTRTLKPNTLAQATEVLYMLREAGVKVFASEGNHDASLRQRDSLHEANWYEYLAGEQLLYYLREEISEGQLTFPPWDEELGAGGYIDLPELDGVRIAGTQWYGTRTEAMLPAVREALLRLPPAKFTILLFHGGIKDYVNSYSGGADYEQFVKLRDAVNYLALGHVHRPYSRQNWLFNPGSLESTTILDFFTPGGAYLVTVDVSGSEPEIAARHVTDFYRRQFAYTSIECDLFESPEKLQKEIVERALQIRVRPAKLPEEFADSEEPPLPIAVIDLKGVLGFPFSSLPIKELEEEICQRLPAQYCQIRNKTIPRELSTDALADEFTHLDRKEIERLVFTTLISEDLRYKERAPQLSKWMLDLKEEILRQPLDTETQRQYIETLLEIIQPEK